jgi:hypothetical protein
MYTYRWSVSMKFWWATGYLCGLLTSYLKWGLPVHVALLRDRKARKIRAEIDRIEGGFTTRLYTPLTAPPPSFRERVTDRFLQWCEDWRNLPQPLTPELVAEIAYWNRVEELNGKQQDEARLSYSHGKHSLV